MYLHLTFFSGAGVVVAVPLIGLPALGFGAAGITAGSIAAAIQSILYGGLTSGVFSILQGIGKLFMLSRLHFPMRNSLKRIKILF